jgi:hypothetical protein
MDEIKRMSIKDLVSEEGGAARTGKLPEMEPYIRLMMAGMQHADITTNVQEIAQLPIERRYVWRVASALKWGFADFESVNVAVDRQTLSPDDIKKIAELLRLRPMQFCMFLKTLFGTENMERMMSEAIKVARHGVRTSPPHYL